MITYEEIRKANETIKTTNIQNKEYAEVPQRIKAFRMVYPEGFILTEIKSLENGVVIFTATVGYREDGNERVLGTGTAYEKEGSTFINKTSYIENCVPLSTQILTENGWKYYYQLRKGDKILSMNMETRRVEYCALKAINIYKDAPLVNISSSRFNATCTPQHKWITNTQTDETWRKTKTEDLKVSDRLIQNYAQTYTPSLEGRKLGWLMCDCEINRTSDGLPSTAYIRQAKYIKEITELFGEGREVKVANPEWSPAKEWVVKADEVREILGRFDIARYEDLAPAMLKADINDVAGCFESMMLADGDGRRFSSTYRPLVDAAQVMCVRLGIPTSFITKRMCQGATKPIYSLAIKTSKSTYASELKMTPLPPADVWCPTTENGTWFMKQGTFVTLTSNCETSAVGRALGMAGFGIDTSIASAEEVQNAIANQGDRKPTEKKNASQESTGGSQERKASEAQLKIIRATYKGANLNKLLEKNGLEKLEDMTMRKASELIGKLNAKKGA